MGDEEDRKKLGELNEREREQILFEREEKRDVLEKRWEIEKVESHSTFLYLIN